MKIRISTFASVYQLGEMTEKERVLKLCELKRYLDKCLQEWCAREDGIGLAHQTTGFSIEAVERVA